MAENTQSVERRERRRKKILENSEERLNKVLGYEKLNSKGSRSSPDDSTDCTNTTRSLSDNDCGTSPSPFDAGHRPTAGNEVHTRQRNSPVREQDASNESVTEATLWDMQAKTTLRQTGATSHMVIVVRRFFCVVIAILIRLVLSQKENVFYQQSIFYPFLLLEGFIVSYDLLFMEHKPSTLGTFSQLLCAMTLSVSSSVTDKISNVITAFTKVMEDLAIYIFTFVIVHWGIETYQL